ncbi:Elongation factor P [Phycisphaerae bacterium RAS1]|nr:Elongation factor P [Phycisphaerae bacterium RAS1]
MIKASELKKGKVILHENNLYSVSDITRVSKGNWRSYLQAKLKSLKTGYVIDVRLAVDDRIETPFVETKQFEYLYREGNDFVVMDQTTFDQIHIPAEVIGDADQYLKGNEIITCSFVDGKIVGVELPNTVALKVVDTPPVVKGATATNQTKDAELETGLRVKVPPFIEIGEMLNIDTRTGEYLERA